MGQGQNIAGNTHGLLACYQTFNWVKLLAWCLHVDGQIILGSNHHWHITGILAWLHVDLHSCLLTNISLFIDDGQWTDDGVDWMAHHTSLARSCLLTNDKHSIGSKSNHWHGLALTYIQLGQISGIMA